MLTLIPTPLADDDPLERKAFAILAQAAKFPQKNIFLIETPKAGKKRWVQFGLPRGCCDTLIAYNEHNQAQMVPELIGALKAEKNIYVMSDGGLPAFCDPGQQLVQACHQHNIRVTSTPFANSIALALALSGFPSTRFYFAGFLPSRGEARKKELKKILAEPQMTVLIDTPYRLDALLSEIAELNTQRNCCLALDLNLPTEEIAFGNAEKLSKKFSKQKREFILLTKPK